MLQKHMDGKSLEVKIYETGNLRTYIRCYLHQPARIKSCIRSFILAINQEYKKIGDALKINVWVIKFQLYLILF